MIGSLKVTRPHLEWQNILRFTMQKVINVLAVLSFLGTVSIIGGGAYVYVSRDAIVERVRERVSKAATEAIAEALPRPS